MAGVFGDDVDHAVDCVGAPSGAARSADGFDLLHVLEGHVTDIPDGAAKACGIKGAAIDEREDFVGRGAAKATHRDGIATAVDLADLHAGGHAQNIGKGERAGAADVFFGNDGYGSGGAEEFFFGFRKGADVKLGEIFEGGVPVKVGEGVFFCRISEGYGDAKRW